MRAVLQEEKYALAARAVQAAIRQVNGLEEAANIIESVLKLRAAENPVYGKLEQRGDSPVAAALVVPHIFRPHSAGHPKGRDGAQG